MKINRNLTEAKWVDYPDDGVKFKIRAMPMSISMWMPNSDEDFMNFTKKRFLYCCVDWQGLIDENDNEFLCTEENKEFVFDYIQEISLWVTGKLADTADNILEKKTSVSIADGITDQADQPAIFVET